MMFPVHLVRQSTLQPSGPPEVDSERALAFLHKPPPVRREILLSELAVLSDADAEMAAEDGALEGNQAYADLRALSVTELAQVLAREDALLIEIEAAGASGAAEVEARFADLRGLSFEPADELWGLDVGVAGVVVALSVMGACPVASCNGGAFGPGHQSQYAYVAFYLCDAALTDILCRAERTNCGLIAIDGLGHLYGPVEAMIAFGRAGRT